MVKESKKIVVIGIVVVIAYNVPWLILGILHWIVVGLDFGEIKNIQYMSSLSVNILALITSFHLWSRSPSLDGQIKKLFLTSGITFVVITGIFSYTMLNIILEWMGLLSISDALNNAIPSVQFYIFNVEAFKISMPADSFVTFTLLILAISFYLLGMEKYIKQKLPWHTISMLICTALIPVLLLIRNLPNSVWVLSIGTIVVVIWVLYNFLFLFYLYFSTGLKSPKGTPMRKASFMIGFGILFIFITWVIGFAVKTGTPIIDFAALMVSGGLGIYLFNYGFILLRRN